jgi:TonB family protein
MKVIAFFILLLTSCLHVAYSQSLESDLTIYEFTDQSAEFPGGAVGLSNWIAQSFQLPSDILSSEQGKIFISFVVEKDGSVSNIRIIKGLTERLNVAAMKVVEKMPKWKPALNNGKVVRSKFTLPISIAL